MHVVFSRGFSCNQTLSTFCKRRFHWLLKKKKKKEKKRVMLTRMSQIYWVMVMVFNATLDNILVISCRSV